ncbi:MAG: sigma-54-dependent Fis family transcriptional regulator [Acidobacteria bacterium]|nr:sigma-54-dependent Fis family transcriptional regulator [Acidobacteriota bacterium]
MPTSTGSPTVLVVEDDSDLRQVVVDTLESHGFAVAQAADVSDALARLEGFAYDGLVLDLRLPDGDGFDILDAARERYPAIRSVVVTGCGGTPEAVKALKRGADDFLVKPFPLMDLARLLHDGIVHREAIGDEALQDDAASSRPFANVIGRSAAMRHVLDRLKLVAPMNSTILVQGETGTGKELIARTIHEHSPRRAHPFVAFNAAAIPEGLIEAELFGHVKGAFTGAVAARAGRFEAAHKGTLFIDEVASMPPPLQTKLLRALQEREFERVGESRSVKFDVRVIAATNVDLRELVKDGRFREDLFYRLNVVPLALPPLRARRDDVPLLAQHFLQKSCRSNGVPARTLLQPTLRCLMDYGWPGNIRELENAMEHAVAMSGTERDITEAMLPGEVRSSDRSALLPPVTIPDEGINFLSVMSQLERELIVRCLEKTGGNKRQAARLLNLSRTTLIDKLQRLGAGLAAGSA